MKIKKTELTFERLLRELDYPDAVEDAVRGRLFDPHISEKAFDAYKGDNFDFALCRRMPLTRLTVITFLLRQKYGQYKEKGVSDGIIFDTFRDVSLRAALYHERMGKVGLGKEDVIWFRHVMNVGIFKIGVLQFQPFEMIYLDEETVGERYMKFSPEQKAALPGGTPVVNCHIQRGADIEYNKVCRSMDDARKFFRAVFPDVSFRAFLCYSWLLYPKMTEQLPADSNIRRFASLFSVIGECDDSAQALENLFGAKKTEPESAKTSLQKLAAENIASFGYACGICRF